MTQRSAVERLQAALARIDDPNGEGTRACLTVYRAAAKAAAEAADARARHGTALGALDGVLVSIKDLFDVAGEVTRAGSQVIAQEGKSAAADAAVVHRLRAAGAVILAKTNMTEFAFSGVGSNPHFGTPANPADRSRIPGGSTSGGAVAVADDFCAIAIGSDTGGSCRIPAAQCGIVGWKPSQARLPLEGVFPLSPSLDSVGAMAKTVAACADADAVMAGEEPRQLEPAPLAGLRLGIAQGAPLEGLDATLSKRFPQALDLLEKAGARLAAEKLPLLDAMAAVNAKGGIAPAEAFAVHRDRLDRRGADIDPAVRLRLERARKISAADYVEMLRRRGELVRAMDDRLGDLDALVMPTTPIVAPTMAEVASSENFGRNNALLLRNPSIVNFFDLCALSLPLPRAGGLPCGLMLIGRNGQDHRLLRIGAAVERVMTA